MTEFTPVIGQPQRLAPDLSVVVAPNASAMTHTGTNTYLIGDRALTIIDPGPADSVHLDALLRAINGRHVSHILLTHSHLDHSPLARPLADRTGAPVLAFGPSHAGRSAVMQSLADQGLTGGGEGIDHKFHPDVSLTDGAILDTAAGPITALHTPGHIGNHMCFRWHDAIFTGDHVMGWASSLVSPPDGDLTEFMQSCARLATLDTHVFYPGHGAPVMNPAERLTWLITHRKSRETQIKTALSQRAHDIGSLTQVIYTDTPKTLIRAAERNVFAHLIDLHGRGQVAAAPSLGLHGEFSLRKTDNH